ncbi:MAG: FAD binding domain-containing protein [Gemmatimonadetes bacterium]|nr:FAD binding domain-containing protein [Gemmatimonadota bacterium]
MQPFTYHQSESTADAVRALTSPVAVPLGGGTDLLVAMKEHIAHPETLVDLRRIPGARAVELHDDGSARLGCAVRIEDLAAHAGITKRYAALAQAAAAVGTPQLRTMGTLGGNLAQRPRCWYFRGGLPCFKNGAADCLAETGENHYHGLFTTGTCHAVHPSDPLVALTALEAAVEVTGASGVRTLTLAALFEGAAQRPEREVTLAPGEFISAVLLPASAAGGVQFYEKLMQRGAWDFATVSLAAHRGVDGTVRMAFGGLSLGPCRVNPSVEEDVTTGDLDDDSIDALAERAMYDAKPLEHNGYKVWQAQALLRRAMRRLDPL